MEYYEFRGIASTHNPQGLAGLPSRHGSINPQEPVQGERILCNLSKNWKKNRGAAWPNYNPRKQSVALCPPKPSELLRTVPTAAFRAALGI